MNETQQTLIDRVMWFEIRFKLEVRENGKLPRFLGSVMHGAFGHSIRLACEMFPSASELNDLCYSGDSSDNHIARNPNWCQPFTFDIGLHHGGEVPAGKMIPGKLIAKPQLASNESFLPALLIALQLMAEGGLGPDRVKMDVREAQLFPAPVFAPRREGIAVYPSLFQGSEMIQKHPFQKQLTIRLETPTQIVSRGRVLQAMDGPIFFRRLWQRVVAWSDTQLGRTIHPPFFDEICVDHDHTRWWSLQRYSSRQQKKLDISGLIGEVAFGGLDEFSWALLCLGRYLHVGKSTTSGLGRYRLLP